MSDLIEKLRNIPQFKSIRNDDLEWLVAKSEIKEAEAGRPLFNKGDSLSHMYMILEGKLAFMINQNGNYFESGSVKEYEITGVLPFSRAKTAQGDGIAKTNLKVLCFPKTLFKEMIQEHFDLVEPLVHTMSSRVRDFTTQSLQNEKMISLGKISAGLAHELNNPSAAIVRSSNELKKHLTTVPDRFKKVISIRLSAQQVDEVNDILFSRIRSGNMSSLSLMDRNEKEDEIAEYLEDKGSEDGFSTAATFIDFNLTIDDLKKIHSIVNDDYFITVTEWLESVLSTEKLVNDIEESSKRINDLVSSVKSYTHMDRSPDKQAADIHDGIRNTVTILNHKIKSANIEYQEDFFDGLPPVMMFVSEINQVWTNLIDNAIDAIEKDGKIKISTYREIDSVIVEIEDSGPGIPDEIKTKIFDPFFTTKNIGKGTGLGLDITQKIISKHNGSICFDSKPGKTVFTISLPIN